MSMNSFFCQPGCVFHEKVIFTDSVSTILQLVVACNNSVGKKEKSLGVRCQGHEMADVCRNNAIIWGFQKGMSPFKH